MGFAAAGLSTVVLPWRDGVLSAVPAADVVAFDTASRDVFAPERAGAVAEWCPGGAWFYKKVDSTLRGDVAGELAAVERARVGPRVVIAPAFPELGRTCAGGVQRWDGGEVDVAALLGREVVDAERTEELDALARELEGSPERPLLVGSGGLAAAFARRRGASSGVVPAGGPGPALVVSGSRTELAARQVARLRSLGTDAVLLSGPVEDTPDVRAALARVATSVLRRIAPRLVVVVGGDTAHALCAELGITELWAVGEVEPGAPLLRAGSGLQLVLKSGSFGDDDALARIVTAA